MRTRPTQRGDGSSPARRRFLTAGVAVAATTAVLAGFAIPAVAATAPGYVSAPQRLMDTRNGTGGPTGPVSGFVPLSVPASVVPTGDTAVLTVTATGSTGAGYVVVYPAGQNKPPTSNVNFTPGSTQPDLVAVQTSSSGQVDMYVGGSATQLVVDLDGYFQPGAYTPLAASRIADSRTGLGLGQGPFTGARTLTLPASLPTGGGPVALTVTATGSSGSGFVTVYPAGSPRPPTSNVNFAPATSEPDLVFVTPNASHQVTVYVGGSAVQVVVDLDGYVPSGSAVTSLAAPVRALDTRTTTGPVSGPVSFTVPSSVPSTATSIIVTLTATGATGPGYLVAYPAGTTRPDTSNNNFTAGTTHAVAALVQIGANRQVTVYVGGNYRSDVIVDIDGYVTG